MTMKKILNQIKMEFTVAGIVHPRYYHTIGVIEMALTLNNVHQLHMEKEKIILAAGFHDIAKLLDKSQMLDILVKNYPNEVENLLDYPQIWHSFAGPIYAKEKYYIDDEKVLQAIKYHTTGRPNMTNLEKIIFVSDYIEKITRKEASMIETRKIALKDLDSAVCKTLGDTIMYLKQTHKKIYDLTQAAYDYYLAKEN